MNKLFIFFGAGITALASCLSGIAIADSGIWTVPLVSTGAVWRYLDTGSNQGTSWRNRIFNDASWSSGRSELGYGDGDEATIVSYGANPNNKYVTTYFRMPFAVTNIDEIVRLNLGVQSDAGCAVYLNGSEVYRFNMPASWWYLTVASSEATGAVEKTFYCSEISASGLISGTNVLAAEVHISAANDPDMSFNAFLTGVVPPQPRAGFWTASTVDRLAASAIETNMQGAATSNFSACCMSDSNEMFILISAPPSIQVYDLNGTDKGRTIALPGFVSPKGICRYDPDTNLYAVVEEGSNDITVISIPTSAVSVAKSSGTTFRMGLSFADPNKGIEGVAYDRLRGCWYAVKESDPMEVYKVQKLGGTNVQTTALFNAQQTFTNRCSSLSDLSFDPYGDRMYIVSGSSRIIFECDLSGNILGSNSLAGSSPQGVYISDSGEAFGVVGTPNEYHRYALDNPHMDGGQNGTVVFPVTLAWKWTSTVSVVCSVTSETAVAGVDYNASAGLLTYTSGMTSNNLSLNLLTNEESLSNKPLQVVISSVTNCAPGRARIYDLTILTNHYNLTIASPYPGAVPPPGTYEHYYDEPVTCAVTSSPYIHGATQYVCVGWSGSGSVMASGTSTNTGTFNIRTNSTVTWKWTTNYWLACEADTGGSSIRGNRWLAYGTNMAVEAVAFEGYRFAGWTGDTGAEDTNNPAITITMDAPKSLRARFAIATNAVGDIAIPRIEFAVTSRIDRFNLVYSNLNMPGVLNDNFSGITLMTTTNEFLIVQNKSGGVLASNAPGIQVYGKDDASYKKLIALQGFTDIEGICRYKPESNLFAVCEEGYGEIAIVKIDPATTNINKSDANVISLGFGAPYGSSFNRGIEGISYDRINDRFFAVKEKDPMECFVITTNSGVLTLPLFDAQSLLTNVVTDTADLFYDDHDGRLFILGEEINLVIECDLHGNILSTLSIPGSQPEGITLSDDRREMFITGEPDEYYRYQLRPPSAITPEGTQVELPVILSIAFTNTVTVDFSVTSTNATPEADFTPASGTIVFNPGIMTSSVSIYIPFDTGVEGNESFRVSLTNPANASLGCDIVYDCTIPANTTRLLRVVSPVGSTLPLVGTNYLLHGFQTNCAVLDSPVLSGIMATQYVCEGWAGDGSVPISGQDTNTPLFAITQDSSITWLWRTNYWLAVQTNGSGTVTNGNRWLPALTNTTLTANPLQYRHFAGWSGDTGGGDTNNPALPLLMNRCRAIIVSFGDDLATNGTPVWWIEQNYPGTNDYNSAAISDTDGDGMTAWEEYVSGTTPTNGESVFEIVSMRKRTDGIIDIYWKSVSNKYYAVFKSTNLSTQWITVPITDNVPGEASGINTVTDTNTSFSPTYYRIVVQ